MKADITKALDTEGWMSREELQWLGEQALTHSLIVEIGSYLGRSTRALADNTPGKVIAVDDWYGPRLVSDTKPDGTPFTEADRKQLFIKFSKNMKDHLESGKVTAVKADCKSLDEFKELKVKPDMVFIDGSHTYEDVTRDIKFWKERITPGGLLCGHDSNYAPIAAAIRDLKFNVGYALQTTIWIYQ